MPTTSNWWKLDPCACDSLYRTAYYHKIFIFAVLERWLIYDHCRHSFHNVGFSFCGFSPGFLTGFCQWTPLYDSRLLDYTPVGWILCPRLSFFVDIHQCTEPSDVSVNIWTRAATHTRKKLSVAILTSEWNSNSDEAEKRRCSRLSVCLSGYQPTPVLLLHLHLSRLLLSDVHTTARLAASMSALTSHDLSLYLYASLSLSLSVHLCGSRCSVVH